MNADGDAVAETLGSCGGGICEISPDVASLLACVGGCAVRRSCAESGSSRLRDEASSSSIIAGRSRGRLPSFRCGLASAIIPSFAT